MGGRKVILAFFRLDKLHMTLRYFEIISEEIENINKHLKRVRKLIVQLPHIFLCS